MEAAESIVACGQSKQILIFNQESSPRFCRAARHPKHGQYLDRGLQSANNADNIFGQCHFLLPLSQLSMIRVE